MVINVTCVVAQEKRDKAHHNSHDIPLDILVNSFLMMMNMPTWMDEWIMLKCYYYCCVRLKANNVYVYMYIWLFTFRHLVSRKKTFFCIVQNVYSLYVIHILANNSKPFFSLPFSPRLCFTILCCTHTQMSATTHMHSS